LEFAIAGELPRSRLQHRPSAIFEGLMTDNTGASSRICGQHQGVAGLLFRAECRRRLVLHDLSHCGAFPSCYFESASGLPREFSIELVFSSSWMRAASHVQKFLSWRHE
jgi:hypothetical protein